MMGSRACYQRGVWLAGWDTSGGGGILQIYDSIALGGRISSLHHCAKLLRRGLKELGGSPEHAIREECG